MPAPILTPTTAATATEAELRAFFRIFCGEFVGQWERADVFTRAAAAHRLAEIRGLLNPKALAEALAEAELQACLDMIGPGPMVPRKRRPRLLQGRA